MDKDKYGINIDKGFGSIWWANRCGPNIGISIIRKMHSTIYGIILVQYIELVDATLSFTAIRLLSEYFHQMGVMGTNL
jgi:hypothetical protein